MARQTLCLLVLGSLLSGLATAAEPSYKAPRLADGRPDLQGIWTHSNATPLERPAGVETLLLSEEQVQVLHSRQLAGLADPRALGEPSEYFDERRFEKVAGTLRSSLIIEPQDGRIPATALHRQALGRARVGVLLTFDGPEQRPSSERCLGAIAAQPPMLSTASNNLHQIVQTPDAVLIVSETNHEARIVRMNAVHLPPVLQTWTGDSVGRWDGDTLVIETKHFTPSDKARLDMGTGFIVSPQTTVIERIRRVAADELSYTFSLEDPAYYEQRWTAESHLLRSADPILEFACHEGNYALTNILRGGRAQDGGKPVATAAAATPP